LPSARGTVVEKLHPLTEPLLARAIGQTVVELQAIAAIPLPEANILATTAPVDESLTITAFEDSSVPWKPTA
jgi:hypothetical protein